MNDGNTTVVKILNHGNNQTFVSVPAKVRDIAEKYSHCIFSLEGSEESPIFSYRLVNLIGEGTV